MHNLISNLFKKGKSPCIQDFPEIRIKRQILDHHIKGDCNTIPTHGILYLLLKFYQHNQIEKDKAELKVIY